MTFKEFTAWCNERACDGRWNMLSAMVCIDLMAEIRKIPFWKRERVWREQHEKQVLAKIVDPLNQKIPINELARRTSHTPETTTSEKEHPTMTINEYQSQALRTESHVTADPAPYIRILDGLMAVSYTHLGNREVARMKLDAIDHFYPHAKIIKEEGVCRYRELEEGEDNADH